MDASSAQAIETAKGVEQLGIIGVLTLVIIASWTIIVLLWRDNTKTNLTFAAIMAEWTAIGSEAAKRARRNAGRIDALDERLDRLTDKAPGSKRGGR
jgi:hypothetical protein